jgi:hypothetical protein
MPTPPGHQQIKIDMGNIPQIPGFVAAAIAAGREDLTPEEEAWADLAIAHAMARMRDLKLLALKKMYPRKNPLSEAAKATERRMARNRT